MLECECGIVGAGPAGLSAAIEAAKTGVRDVIVIDENARAGGQLFKQIHKFFGGAEHKAKMRGIDIAHQMVEECRDLGVKLLLDTAVYGIFQDNVLALHSKGEIQQLKAKRVLLATGASENPLAFPGWTLPGVLGAGAAQTMMNVWRVRPGDKALVVGAGNVGLIVSYQLMQAGTQVVAVVEILPRISGYKVHASKITRLGVPILTSHTIKEAQGDSNNVEEATICEVDPNYKPIPGTERYLSVDTVCIAAGLSPLAELAWLAGCEFQYIAELGGYIPVHNEDMQTTIHGVYVAGDVSGIEEASTAMMEGAIAGLAMAESLEYLSKENYEELKRDKAKGLEMFRKGRFEFRRVAKEKLQRKEGKTVKQCFKD